MSGGEGGRAASLLVSLRLGGDGCGEESGVRLLLRSGVTGEADVDSGGEGGRLSTGEVREVWAGGGPLVTLGLDEKGEKETESDGVFLPPLFSAAATTGEMFLLPPPPLLLLLAAPPNNFFFTAVGLLLPPPFRFTVSLRAEEKVE